MYKIIIIFILIFPQLLEAQIKGDYIWVGGIQAYPGGGKVNGHVTNFNVSGAKPIQQDMRYGFTGNNASISDENGNLLFYFNGCAVMNRYHHVMPNGDSINAGRWFDLLWKDCRFGYPGAQEVLILPDPVSQYGYFILHQTNIYYPQMRDSNQLSYTYVDMRLDNGNGGVTLKNEPYYPLTDLMLSYFTAIQNENRKDWWIIKPLVNNSLFLVFCLNENGINLHSKQNSNQFFDESRSSGGGTARFSPDGKKISLYNYNDQLHIYDFDRATGLLSNHQKIEIYSQGWIDNNPIFFGSVEWSPNSRFIYCSSYLKLHQIDMWEEDIQNGVRHIADYNGTLDPFPTELFLMVQGPDCKIYMTPKNGSFSLHVINKPDELGTDCDFVQNAIKLPNTNSGTLPNFPRFRVDEDKKCDPSITSLFGETVYYRRDLEVFPNPSNGIFQIKIPELLRDGTLKVSDMYGRICYQKHIHFSVLEEIDITAFPSGRYNIELYPLDISDSVYYGKQVVKI